ncbi:DUF4845 domain-containing protein [Ramlibacter sp.]|uniref:DUF4845 domain-containing protein n=1 Tax=Ramlibacter sp. TaxID=1917967 RepID=UPI003D0AFC3D
MRQQAKSGQRGVSFIGVIFVIAVLAFVGLVGAQAFPTYLEYQSVQKAVNKAKEGSSVPEVRIIFDKAAQVDDIKSITGKDLDVAKENDKVVVRFAYNKEIHIFGPAFLLLKYAGQSK